MCIAIFTCILCISNHLSICSIDDKDQLFGCDKAGTSRSVYHKSEDLSNDDSELEHLSTLSMYAVRFGDSSPPVLPAKSLKRVKEIPLVEQDDGRTSGAQESPSLFSDTGRLRFTSLACLLDYLKCLIIY